MKKLLFTLSIFVLTGCEKVFFEANSSTDNLAVYDYFLDDFKNTYALFKLKGINPDTLGNAFRKQITANTSQKELFDKMAKILDMCKDGHNSIKSPFGVYTYDFWSKAPANDQVNLSNYVNFGPAQGIIEYRSMKEPDLGYVNIKSFDGSASDFEKIDDALATLGNKKGLIIDVRSNGGGNSENSEIVASRFATKALVYGKVIAKIGKGKNDFSEWIDTKIAPAGKAQYLKPVVILTNRRSFSSTEIFTMIMQNFPNVAVVGDTTGGGMGNPTTRELPNGWLYRASSKQRERANGAIIEGKGIYPNVAIWNTPKDVQQGRDRILEKAIELLK